MYSIVLWLNSLQLTLFDWVLCLLLDSYVFLDAVQGNLGTFPVSRQ